MRSPAETLPLSHVGPARNSARDTPFAAAGSMPSAAAKRGLARTMRREVAVAHSQFDAPCSCSWRSRLTVSSRSASASSAARSETRARDRIVQASISSRVNRIVAAETAYAPASAVLTAPAAPIVARNTKVASVNGAIATAAAAISTLATIQKPNAAGVPGSANSVTGIDHTAASPIPSSAVSRRSRADAVPSSPAGETSPRGRPRRPTLPTRPRTRPAAPPRTASP